MDELDVTIRHQRGKTQLKALRRDGMIPAILYGHGQESVSLALPARQVDAMVRHGSHIVELKGDVNQSAQVKEIQWDALGSHVLHLDLTRVDAAERVEVQLPVMLRGEAVGTHHGGVMQLLLHEVVIECPASKVPDRLEVKVRDLDVGQSITAADVPLPDGASLVTEPEEVVAQCVAAAAFEAPELEEAVEPGAAEPEVIGRKEEQEEEGSEKN